MCQLQVISPINSAQNYEIDAIVLPLSLQWCKIIQKNLFNSPSKISRNNRTFHNRRHDMLCYAPCYCEMLSLLWSVNFFWYEINMLELQCVMLVEENSQWYKKWFMCQLGDIKFPQTNISRDMKEEENVSSELKLWHFTQCESRMATAAAKVQLNTHFQLNLRHCQCCLKLHSHIVILWLCNNLHLDDFCSLRCYRQFTY